MTNLFRSVLSPLRLVATLALLLSACGKDSKPPPPAPAPTPTATESASAPDDAGTASAAAPPVPDPDEPPEEVPRGPERKEPEDKREIEKFPTTVPLRKVSPAVIARLSKSLATVMVNDQSFVAVVVARRGDRLTLLTLHPSADAKVMYRSGTRTQTVSDVRIVGNLANSQAALLSAPAPKFPVPPLAIESPRWMEAGEALLLARSGAKPFLEPARVLGQDRQGARFSAVDVDLGKPGHTDGILIDPQSGSVVVIAHNTIRQAGSQRATVAADGLGAATGQPTNVLLTVSPEAGERCRVDGQVSLGDWLGDAREVALSLGAPGQELPWRMGTRIDEPTDFVARAKVRPDGTATLNATFEPCRAPRYAQLQVIGKLVRRWSVPVPLPLPAPSPRSRTVPSLERHWRLEPTPHNMVEGDPKPVPLGERCKPLDPDTVYLAGAGVGSKCGGSSVSTGLAALDDASKSRCISVESPSAFLGILPDGRLLDAYQGVYRLRAACPRFDSTSGRWAMPVVAVDPCGPRGGDRLPTFFAPDGSLVFQCSEGYADAWGMPVDFHGGWLVRLGAGGRSLVVAPRGGFAVLGADGIADEVLGLPEDACLQKGCPLVSFATDTGFLVALRRGTPEKLSGPLQLFEIPFDGQAKDRGAFPSLPEGLKASTHRLDAKGRMLVSASVPLPQSHEDSVPRHFAFEAGAAEPKLLRKASGTLLVGPRASGPTELLRPDAFKPSTENWKYRRPRRLGLECDTQLRTFDPKRVYLFEQPVVWDAEEPAQRSFGITANIDTGRVTRGGQFLYTGAVEYRTFMPDDWRLLPGEKRCGFDEAGNRPDPKLTLCEEPEDLVRDVRPRPDSDALVVLCQAYKGGSYYLLHEGRRLKTPGYGVIATGPKGLVLVEAVQSFKKSYHLVKPRGASVPVSGLPEGLNLHSARASASGIDVVLVKQWSWQEPPLEAPELWTIDASGKASRVGAYPAELLSLGKRMRWLLLGAERSLYASFQKQDETTDVVVRAELGGGAPKELFTGPTNHWRRPFTGP